MCAFLGYFFGLLPRELRNEVYGDLDTRDYELDDYGCITIQGFCDPNTSLVNRQFRKEYREQVAHGISLVVRMYHLERGFYEEDYLRYIDEVRFALLQVRHLRALYDGWNHIGVEDYLGYGKSPRLTRKLHLD